MTCAGISAAAGAGVVFQGSFYPESGLTAGGPEKLSVGAQLSAGRTFSSRCHRHGRIDPTER
jgi:hypothetical protein